VLIDPRSVEIRRVIRTAGTVIDNAQLRLVADYLKGERGVVGNSFDAGIAASLSDENRSLRVEPFALLHQLED